MFGMTNSLPAPVMISNVFPTSRSRNMIMRFQWRAIKCKTLVNFISKEYEAKPHSEETARLIDEEAKNLIEEAESRCILTEHRAARKNLRRSARERKHDRR